MKIHINFPTAATKFLLFCLLSISLSLKLEEVNTGNNSSKNVFEPPKVPPRANMSTPEMVESDGYECETHEVVTEDGYILTVFRIKMKNTPVTGCPILIQHGLLSSSDDWLMNEWPYFCLPYILLRQGWDVWLGNCRGNKYSMAHKTLSPQDSKYWDFSFHEMGKYDLPAVIAYILSESAYDQIDYVGYSMGCTMFFIAMSLHPEFMNLYVNKMSALAPAVYISEAKSPIMMAADVAPSPMLKVLLDILCKGQIIPTEVNDYLTQWGPTLCSSWGLSPLICHSILYIIAGYNPENLSDETIAIVTGHTPTSGSGKTLTHFMQYAQRESFQGYDYGMLENLYIYGSPFPPLYDLSACKRPVFVVYGQSDWLVDAVNVLRFLAKLSYATFLKVPHEGCNHLDFAYHPLAPPMIYKPVVEFHCPDCKISPPIPFYDQYKT